MGDTDYYKHLFLEDMQSLDCEELDKPYDFGMVFEFITIVTALKVMDFTDKDIKLLMKIIKEMLADDKTVNNITLSARKFIDSQRR